MDSIAGHGRRRRSVPGGHITSIRSRRRPWARHCRGVISGPDGDLIISLDGYASAEGWPGWWGLERPEYLEWLEQEGEKGDTFLLGANTYRVMSSMSEEAAAEGSGFSEDEGASLTGLAAVPRSSSPLPCRRPWLGPTRNWSPVTRSRP